MLPLLAGSPDQGRHEARLPRAARREIDGCSRPSPLRRIRVFVLACWMGHALTLFGQTAGDIAFVGWNSDGNDDLVFVTFVDIAASTVIHFRDDEYDSGWDGTGEGAISWTAPAAGITAGTVVQIYDCTVASPTVSTGTCVRADATFDIANGENAVYAYLASGWDTAPFTFMAALCNATSFGTLLNGTGLTDGTHAWSWGNLDNWRYDGIRTGTVAELKTALQNSANWSSADGSGDQSYTFDLSPFVIQSGAAPEIAVLGTNGTEIAHGDSSPSAADGTLFGSLLYPGGLSLTNTFTVTNSGTAALILSGSPSVSLSGDADFTVSAQPASTNIAAGDAVTFSIVFDPAASGARTSLVSIANNDGNENPYWFAILGTGVAPVAPSVTTSNITTVGTTDAEGGGAITSDGGDAVTNKGLCWGTITGPTVGDSTTSEGSGSNAFASTITGLVPGETYYVRAYAQNSVGTGYGGEVVITTLCFSAPVAAEATGILDTQFTANWGAVDGADGYLLDVSTSATFSVAASGAGLFISQYYEGASFDKWIEIYNAGAAAVTLTDLGYRLGLYSNTRRESWKTNGAPDNTVALTGTVAAGSTYVVRNPSASLPAYAAADQDSSTVINFNGDDSVVLYTGATFATASVVDSIGLTGNDLENTSVVRRTDITSGQTGTGDYDPADWVMYSPSAVDAAAAGTVERIGYHATIAGDFVPGYEAREVGDVTAHAVTGLSVGVTYYYRLRATNDHCVSGHSGTQDVTTVSLLGGVSFLGTTSPTDSTFALDGQVSAGEYGITAAVLSAEGFLTGLLLDADYEHLLLAIQYSNFSTVVWSPGDTAVLFSNDFGTAAFTTLPAVFSNGYEVTGLGRNNGINTPTNGNPDSGYAVLGSNGWTSFGIGYFTNSVTVSNGYRVSFSNLTFQHRRYSVYGPDQWQCSYRIDGVGSFITLDDGTVSATDAWETNVVDLAAMPDVVGESTVEFRYDAWGALEGSTQLTAGVLAIIGYNLAGGEDFTFVVLRPIPEGTVIEFTDNGWMMPENTFRTNESHFASWTAETALAVGDVTKLDLNNMNNNGDQWCAYQVAPGITTFVYAVNAYHTNWQATADANETSALYPDLTNGFTAVAVNYQNAYYTGTTVGTQSELLSSISDPANWTGALAALTLPTNPLTVTDADVGTNNVAWSLDNLAVTARIDPGTGADCSSEVIIVYFDTDAGASTAGITNLTDLTDDSGFLQQGVTFSGADAESADPFWVELIQDGSTNWFDADYAAVLRPGVGGSNGAAFFGLDRDTPGTLTPLAHEALNSKGESTAEFSIPWSSIRDFAAAQAGDLLSLCETGSVYVFCVASVVTNAAALEDNSPPNDSGAGSGAIIFTNVWQLNLAPAFAEPDQKPAVVLFSNKTASTYITWEGGNGSFSLVLMRQGGAVDAAPADGETYSANSTFGAGDEIGVSNYVVAVTNGNSCWVYGLEESEEYHVAVFEGNGLGTCSDYLDDPRRNDMIFTLVVLFSFDLLVDGDDVQVCWETASELFTVGFWVHRRAEDGSWVQVNPEMVLAQGLFNGGVGARYCIPDPGAQEGGTYVYLLVEVDMFGDLNYYGPFERTAAALSFAPPLHPVPGGIAIRWLSRSNELYRVLRSQDLTGLFVPIATGLVATPPENVYTDSVAGIGFYVIFAEPGE